MGGLFGVASKTNCIDDLITGLFSLQNRGETRCGIATSNHKKIKLYNKEGLVLDSFTQEELKKASGNYGIGNTVPLDIDQPIGFDTQIGKLAIAYSGKILNKTSLANKLKKRGHGLSLKHTDTEIIAKLIAEGNNIVNGIEIMAEQVKGIYSIGILTLNGILAFRSPVGVEPLMLGQNNYLIAFASESCALKEIGLKKDQYRDLKPGEIVFIDKKIQTIKQLEGIDATCAFEWGYYGRIDSIFEGISVKKARENCGITLAKEDKKRGLKADVVIPVRESGVGYAIGYHHGSGIPYSEGLFRNWYITRTYIQPTQKVRIKKANRKQSAIEETVEGKIIVVTEDSIRRGTTLRNKLIPMLKNAGAKEVHVRVGSPENKYYCKYSVFPKKRGELLAERGNKEVQRKYIGADSLEYNHIEDYVAAIGLPKEKLCLGCWTGKFPT